MAAVVVVAVVVVAGDACVVLDSGCWSRGCGQGAVRCAPGAVAVAVPVLFWLLLCVVSAGGACFAMHLRCCGCWSSRCCEFWSGCCLVCGVLKVPRLLVVLVLRRSPAAFSGVCRGAVWCAQGAVPISGVALFRAAVRVLLRVLVLVLLRCL